MLGASPLFAIGASPLAFGATDAAAAVAMESPSPSVRVRVVARALAAAAWGGAASTILAARGSDPANASVRMTLLAIFLAVGAIVGSFGSAGAAATETLPPRPPQAEAPLVALLDVLTAGWAFVLAVALHGEGARARVLSTVGLALALGLRALLVARIALAASSAGDDPRPAAFGFVAWLALAATTCTIAASPLTWSGLGAAIVLTVAAALAESRRKRALVLFLRGSLAFAAMLGIATFLAT